QGGLGLQNLGLTGGVFRKGPPSLGFADMCNVPNRGPHEQNISGAGICRRWHIYCSIVIMKLFLRAIAAFTLFPLLHPVTAALPAGSGDLAVDIAFYNSRVDGVSANLGG